jgi:hypothetical protein
VEENTERKEGREEVSADKERKERSLKIEFRGLGRASVRTREGGRERGDRDKAGGAEKNSEGARPSPREVGWWLGNCFGRR